jgi:hypothetical protein
MIGDVLRRPTATVAGLVAVVVGLAVLLFVLFRDTGPPEPIVSISSTGEGIVLRWENPETDKAYGPLVYDVKILDDAGKVQTTYLQDVDNRAWPGCCRLQITPGGAVTKTVPEQSEPVGAIRLVNQYVGPTADRELLPTITCRLTPKPTCSTDD